MKDGYPSPEEMQRIMLSARKMRALEMKRLFGVLRRGLAGLFTTAPGRTATR